MGDNRPSRRTLLKGAGTLGTVAALALPVVILPPAEAAPSDPVFATITAHMAARKRVDAMDSDDADWDATMDEESAWWAAVCACRPASLAGFLAYVAYASSYPDLEHLSGEYGPSPILQNVAATLRDLVAEGVLPPFPQCGTTGGVS